MVKYKRSESLNNLSASLENYLETIAVLKRKKHAQELAISLNI
jgi:hypothetical protein